MLTVFLIVQDMDDDACFVGSLHVVSNGFASFDNPSTRVKRTTILSESLRGLGCLCVTSWNVAYFLRRHCYQS
jgi:hypothetical protein